MADKYQPIPGEMDTIDCLRKERDELRALCDELAFALEDLLNHGLEYENGEVHMADAEKAKDVLEKYQAHLKWEKQK